jgi:hypothetical protein
VRYRIDASRVAHQIVEGEAIIIDFDTGAYYSAGGAAAEIWNWIQQGASLYEIITAMSQRYSGEQADIARSIDAFVEDLQEESLIVPVGDEPDEGEGSLAFDFSSSHASDRPRFEAPSLDKYTDMRDLLLLDPIHEVDEQGWPMRKR